MGSWRHSGRSASVAHPCRHVPAGRGTGGRLRSTRTIGGVDGPADGLPAVGVHDATAADIALAHRVFGQVRDPRLVPGRARSSRPPRQPAHGAGQSVNQINSSPRLTSKSAFARLCGAAPSPGPSGKARRSRLHRGATSKPTASAQDRRPPASTQPTHHRPHVPPLSRRTAQEGRPSLPRSLHSLTRLRRPQSRSRDRWTSIGPSRHETDSTFRLRSARRESSVLPSEGTGDGPRSRGAQILHGLGERIVASVKVVLEQYLATTADGPARESHRRSHAP